jgi:hypothetical protein
MGVSRNRPAIRMKEMQVDNWSSLLFANPILGNSLSESPSVRACDAADCRVVTDAGSRTSAREAQSKP